MKLVYQTSQNIYASPKALVPSCSLLNERVPRASRTSVPAGTGGPPRHAPGAGPPRSESTGQPYPGKQGPHPAGRSEAVPVGTFLGRDWVGGGSLDSPRYAGFQTCHTFSVTWDTTHTEITLLDVPVAVSEVGAVLLVTPAPTLLWVSRKEPSLHSVGQTTTVPLARFWHLGLSFSEWVP